LSGALAMTKNVFITLEKEQEEKFYHRSQILKGYWYFNALGQELI
jgi:hypothetical protein